MQRHNKDNKWVWNTLIQRQLALTKNYRSSTWQKGFNKVKPVILTLPNLTKLSQTVSKQTDWEIVDKENKFIKDKEWFDLLKNRIFPITSYLRTPEQIDHAPKPDMLHEVFGHIPFLYDATYTKVVDNLATAYFSTPKKYRIGISRIWWYTLEWGYMRQNNKNVLLGAALYSSKLELIDSLPKQKNPFNLAEVFNTPKKMYGLQEKYFVAPSLKKINTAIEDYIEKINENDFDWVIRKNGNYSDEAKLFNPRKNLLKNKLDTDR